MDRAVAFSFRVGYLDLRLTSPSCIVGGGGDNYRKGGRGFDDVGGNTEGRTCMYISAWNTHTHTHISSRPHTYSTAGTYTL